MHIGIDVSIYLMYLPIYLAIGLSIYLSINQSIYLSIYHAGSRGKPALLPLWELGGIFGAMLYVKNVSTAGFWWFQCVS